MRWQVRGRPSPQSEFRVDHAHPQARNLLARHLVRLLRRVPGCDRGLTVVCIGTDRSTGDALGPLVGQALSEEAPPGVEVLGTLDEPVHALNLDRLAPVLASREARNPVLAVDACLGEPAAVGTVTAGLGPLYPGAGVRKDLPPVGQLFVTGTVNVSGLLEYVVLQNTRLSLVVRMARVIAAGVGAAAAAVVTVPGAGSNPSLAGSSRCPPPSPTLAAGEADQPDVEAAPTG